jgi:hypothetical protein
MSKWVHRRFLVLSIAAYFRCCGRAFHANSMEVGDTAGQDEGGSRVLHLADKYHMGTVSSRVTDRSTIGPHRSGLQSSNPSDPDLPREFRCLRSSRRGKREILGLMPLLAFGLILGGTRP